jgi:putative ABC transport system permease protein
VAQVIQQYLGTAAYMNIDALSRLLDEPFAMNVALVCTEHGQERELNRRLKDVAGVAAVEIKRDALEGLMATLAESMRISNLFISGFAGVIAFAIIYNSTIVSLAERERELASLRVMGFSTGEVGRIVYHENYLLSAAGLVCGLPFGVALSWLLVKAYDTELYRLPFYVSQATFLKAITLTILFVVLANLAARRKIVRLNMVEVLKSRE